MARRKRELQEINASSMADIAFLLLVFFLVTTTMDTDWGIARLLPPMEEIIDPDKQEVRDRDAIVVLVNANNQLLFEGELTDISQLKDKAIEQIENVQNAVNMPEKIFISKSEAKQKVAELQNRQDDASRELLSKWKKRLKASEVVGDYWESKQVISLQNDRGTSYEMYIKVQNELAAAYRELRDKLAMSKFNKKYDQLEKDQAEAIKEIYAQRISEAEPKVTQ
jgi:biopolymer transport protein ExbD